MLSGLGPALARPARLILALAALALAEPVKVWVLLRDKGPAAARAGTRAWENLPLHAPHLATLARAGLDVRAGLKWQNRVSGFIEPSRLAALRALPCVAAVEGMPRKARPWRPASPWSPSWRPLPKGSAGAPEDGFAGPLHDTLRVGALRSWITASGSTPGKGMRVAVIDADFHLGRPIFDHMRPRIADQWDFVDGDSLAADDGLFSSHGAECMSLIGGNLPGTYVGAAPDAEFLLYRAEDDFGERYVEEDFVAAAIERAVDSGAQVINISLGYRYEYDSEPDLPYEAFDGRTRPSSLAALGAARRNVLVAVSVGNMPDSIPRLPSLAAPSDADSILAVGIVNVLRQRCGYSCTGPSADGRVKPDVVSMGIGNCTVPVANPARDGSAVANFAGTSFASPAVAGAAVLLRQLRPDASAEEVRQALIRTADRYARPDSGVGHGLVDAAAAARYLGLPIQSRLVRKDLSPLYHPGDGSPITLGWDPAKPVPDLQLITPAGRLVPVTVEAAGPLLRIRPRVHLKTGVYFARVP